MSRRRAGKALSILSGPTEAASIALLGWRLVRTLEDGSTLEGRIVETEAYVPDDPASHSYRGPTPRCAPMFGAPGLAYVYRIYGIHKCLNISTEGDGIGAAILIRGLDGIDGCDGPAKLCSRMGIDLDLNGVDMLAPDAPIRLVPARAIPPEPIVTTTRIGITRAAELLRRYYLLGSPGVSRRDRAAERALSATLPLS